MVKELLNYINGEWVQPDSGKENIVLNPANQEVIGKGFHSSKAQTEAAIKVAKENFDSGVWADLSTRERADVLFEIADKIDERAEELATLDTMDNGKILAEAQGDVADAASTFRYYAGLIRGTQGEVFNASEDYQSMIVREPAGVTGLIVPWNYPLLMSVWKIAPALAAGNSIVFKPAELTPLSCMVLFEILDSVEGLPKGTINMIMGEGAVVGQTISESDDVDLVSFTGSTAVGKKIMKASAEGNLKRVSLELGGKSPNVIFADTDLDLAVDYGLFGIFYGTGQVCSAGSRILVEESIYDDYVKLLVEKAEKIKVGPGLDPTSNMGPIVSEIQMQRVLEYIEIGKAEGAKVATGGVRLTEGELANGFFIAPTIFVDVNNDMRIVQEEIFGPVVTVQKFKTEEEAIELANSTRYGLAGAVFSKDGSRAMRVIKKIRSGITWINDYHPTFIEAPWGGFKQSGIGHSLGTYGLEDFQAVKQINIRLKPESPGWFPQ